MNTISLSGGEIVSIVSSDDNVAAAPICKCLKHVWLAGF
jgi:hypothetical protein